MRRPGIPRGRVDAQMVVTANIVHEPCVDIEDQAKGVEARAVWVASAGAPESEWCSLLRRIEREVRVHWLSPTHLVVESRPVVPRTVTWEAVTIEVRKLDDRSGR